MGVSSRTQEKKLQRRKKALIWLLCSLTSILLNLCGKHLQLKQKLITNSRSFCLSRPRTGWQLQKQARSVWNGQLSFPQNAPPGCPPGRPSLTRSMLITRTLKQIHGSSKEAKSQQLILPALLEKDSLGLQKCAIWIHLMMNGELLLRVESRFLFQRTSPKLLKQKSLRRWTLRLHLSLPRLRWASLELVVFLYRQLQKYTGQRKSPSHGNQNLWLKKSNLDFLGLVDSLKMKSIWMKMKFQ